MSWAATRCPFSAEPKPRHRLGFWDWPDSRSTTSPTSWPSAPARRRPRLSRNNYGPRRTETPFFLGAMLTHLEESALLRRADGSWVPSGEFEAIEVPPTARAVIQRRLDRLSTPARRALDVAAVVGQVFNEAIVRSVLGVDIDESLDAFEEAARAGLVREEDSGRLAFPHAIVSQTVLEALSKTRLAWLHWWIGEELERRSADEPWRASEIAYHYSSGLAVGDTATVVRSALTAGDDANSRLAFEDAARQFEVALAAVPPTPANSDVRYRILVSLADCLNCLADIDRANVLWLEAAELARRAGDPERLRTAVFGYMYGSEDVPDPNLARMLDEILDMLPAEDSPVRARVLGRRAAAGNIDPRRARDLAAEAVAMARRTGDTDIVLGTLHLMLELESTEPD